tara:strand:- start:40 stop:156 length:117 start_codon:yes stop_codon:yes gene_type:complete
MRGGMGVKYTTYANMLLLDKLLELYGKDAVLDALEENE